MPREYIEFEDAKLIRSTEMAGLYEIDGEEKWIPFSQIDGGSVDKDGETAIQVVPYPAAQVLEQKARRELGVPPGHTDAGIYGENAYRYAVGAAARVGLLPAEPGCPTNELVEVGLA